MIAILRLTDIWDCVKHAKALAFRGDLRLVPDIFELQSYQIDLSRGSLISGALAMHRGELCFDI